MKAKAMKLVLSDGKVFEGFAYGAAGTATGEVIATSADYVAALTDPASFGQLVAPTSPLVGNVGMVAEDAESRRGEPWASGLILREASPLPSNHRSSESLPTYLERHGVVAIAGVDTRALTKHLRRSGPQHAAMGPEPVESLLRLAREAAEKASEPVKLVTAKEPYTFGDAAKVEASRHVVALDLGVARSHLRKLAEAGCKVTVVPATTQAADILALGADGLFLSNGPGAPTSLGAIVETVRALLGKLPIFGVGLGHQLLAVALGGESRPVATPRRGQNQPIAELPSGKIRIASQAQGHFVEKASLEGRATVTHVFLDGEGVAGIEAEELSAFSVQFQPEGELFQRFASLIDARKVAS